MKNYTSALILNALVLPGSGHYMIGQKLKGAIIAIVATALIFIPVISYALTVLNALNAISISDPGLKSGMDTLSNSWTSNKHIIIVCLLGVVAIWLYGIIDLVRLKKKETHELQNRNQ